jgi:hypothetical protein
MLVGQFLQFRHSRGFGMEFIVRGIMKTRQIAQSMSVQPDCMMSVVATGRKSLHQRSGRWARMITL